MAQCVLLTINLIEMELIEIVKKRLEAKGWDFSSDYWDDEELASLHEIILETEAALRQPPIVGRSEPLICPECKNPYPHSHTDGSYSCEDCGHKWSN